MEQSKHDKHQLLIKNLHNTLGKMEVALGSISEAIAWTDAQGNIQWCNTAFDNLVFLNHLAVLGQHIENILVVKDIDSLLETSHPLHIVKNGMELQRKTYEYISKEGQLFIEVSAHAISIAGDPIYIFFIHDITELKYSQDQLKTANVNLEKRFIERTEKLQEVSNRHQAILDCAVDAIITIDAYGRVLSLNPAVEKLFGYSANDILGNNVSILMPEPHHSNHDSYLQQYIKTGESKIIGKGREVIGKKKTGELFHLDLSVSEVSVGENILFTGILRDISEQKNTIAALEAAKKQSEEANSAKSDFLARISHEIRTPLNAILGMADLLLETELSPEQQKYVQVSRGSGDHLLHIIEDLLDVSRIEAGKLILDYLPFNLSALVEVVVGIIASALGSKEIVINSTIGKGVPEYLKGDPKRLRQILINLMSNSLKFTQTGSISLDIESKGQPDVDGTIEIFFKVSDTGIGVHPDLQKTIFDSFTQADPLITRKYGGTGLGLTICKSLVALMGGTIQVQSRPNEGSVFSFSARFLLCTNDEVKTVPTIAQQPDPTKLQKVSDDAGDFNRYLHILLAEDSPDNQLLFGVYLKKCNCMVDFADNGKIAVEKFVSGVYDIVILDVQMPEMDGYTAAKTIRSYETKNRMTPLPIIALTAHAQHSDKIASLAAGCDMHVVKPVTKHDLIKAIRQLTST